MKEMRRALASKPNQCRVHYGCTTCLVFFIVRVAYGFGCDSMFVVAVNVRKSGCGFWRIWRKASEPRSCERVSPWPRNTGEFC